MILESFRQDVRIGLRVLRKDKTFCFLAVLVLGLGIGGATTQFTVVNAVALRGFSFPHPEQLMSVGLIDPQASAQNNNFGFGVIPSAQDYEDLRSAQRSFAMMAAYLTGSTVNVTYKTNPQRYTGGYVTEDFFKILGVSPILGRDFTADDNKPGAPKVTILGYEIWQRDFNGDPNIVGQNVRINGKAATIIGIMPRNFKFPISEELWVPYYNEFPLRPRGDLQVGANNSAPAVLGRLKPGVTIDQANTEFIGLARRLSQESPKTNQALVSASVRPLLHALTGVQLRQQVWGMLAAVILVLLIACVNVMNMQFGRITLRAKEVAIRGALGATHWRIMRQMLTESLVVASLGAIAGVAIAYWAVDMFVQATNALPFPLPYWIQFKIDGPVFAFTVGVTLVATIVSGLVPAWLSAHGNAAEIMKEGNSSFARKYWGNESAIGRRIRIYNPGEPQPWRTIVGVVPDTLMQGPFDQQTDGAGFYVPLLGTESTMRFCTIIVRPRLGQRADTLGPALSKAVAELDSNLPTYFAGTPAQMHNDILGANRIVVTLFGIFGAVAFILSAVGLYGVMSFSVSQRTQEFGIRMALGADARRIFKMVMTQGAWQLGIGLFLGAGAIATLLKAAGSTAIQTFLFKVNAFDPSIYFLVAGLLTVVAAISCFVPARRATRVDPVAALRYE